MFITDVAEIMSGLVLSLLSSGSTDTAFPTNLKTMQLFSHLLLDVLTHPHVFGKLSVHMGELEHSFLCVSEDIPIWVPASSLQLGKLTAW